MKKFILYFFLLVHFLQVSAQNERLDELDSVVVFSSQKSTIYQLPLQVKKITTKQFEYWASSTPLSAINTTAGVRMEERSPGSYRFSIRGSLIRSPFGVRNVKFYFKNIPFTDAGGNTYVNLLDITQVASLEIAKGPASSLYGSGTGGVVLMNDTLRRLSKIDAGISVGTFQTTHQYLKLPVLATNHHYIQFQVSNFFSEGYREHSELSRKTVQLLSKHQLKKITIETVSFYTNLFYQTPGALTLQQYLINPKASRPASGNLPSAKSQNASVKNQTIFSGIEVNRTINAKHALEVAASMSNTKFINPFITNYEIRKEENFAQRFIFKSKWTNRLTSQTGIEFNFNKAHIKNFQNQQGNPGNLQFNDYLKTRQHFVFVHAAYRFHHQFNIHAGVSVLQQLIGFLRTTSLTEQTFIYQPKSFISPRIGLNFQPKTNQSFFIVLSRGFSPPTLSELRPSSNQLALYLKPEQGYNLEIGHKGSLLNDAFTYTISLYQFKLKDAIIRLNDSTGADYFVNAGSTQQSGLEVETNYQKQFGKYKLQLVNNFTFQKYRYVVYRNAGNAYNNNIIPGIPKQVFINGFTVAINKSMLSLLAQSISNFPLNDANTFFAEPVTLLQLKIAQSIQIKKHQISMEFLIENLLDEQYSLGYDINAAANRFYNAAAGRNFLLSLKIN